MTRSNLVGIPHKCSSFFIEHAPGQPDLAMLIERDKKIDVHVAVIMFYPLATSNVF